MPAGTTTDPIDEPEALDIALFRGRDEAGKTAFVVRVSIADGMPLDFSIKRLQVLGDAAASFTSAMTFEQEVQHHQMKDLLDTINQELDLSGASDSELISYVTDIRDAARRLR